MPEYIVAEYEDGKFRLGSYNEETGMLDKVLVEGNILDDAGKKLIQEFVDIYNDK